jgi:hypothetical protein
MIFSSQSFPVRNQDPYCWSSCVLVMSDSPRRRDRAVKKEPDEDGPSTSKYFSSVKAGRVKKEDDDEFAIQTIIGTGCDQAGPSRARHRRSSSVSPPRLRKRVKLEDPPSPLQNRSGSSPLTDLEELPAHLAVDSPLQAVPITVIASSSVSSSAFKSKSKKPTIKLKLEKPHPTPPNWEHQYGLIVKMRAKIVAPVDTL